MIDWEKEYERVEELAGGVKPKDGEVIHLSRIETIEEKEEKYTQDDGSVRRVIRFYYKMPDRTIIVPFTLHRKIAKIKKEYGDRVTKVRVAVTGEGKFTRYDALPVL